MGRAVGKRGCGGRLGETVAAKRLPGPTSSVGGAADVFLDRITTGDMSKDYERLPETGEAFIYVAMSPLMVKRLARS